MISALILETWSTCIYMYEPWLEISNKITMWYVWPAKRQISLRIHTVWSEPLLVAWIFYDCLATGWASFRVSKLKKEAAQVKEWVYTCKCHIVGNHILQLIWARRSKNETIHQLQLISRVLLHLDSVHYLGLVLTKPVFGVSENARLKPVSSATETS